MGNTFANCDIFTKNIHVQFYNRTKDMFHQDAFSAIKSEASKLRTYGLIKEEIGAEGYLMIIKNTKHRVSLSRLRLSNHKLMIEVGRHQKPKLEPHERICEVCKNGVEDEIHFLINCPLYDAHRQAIINQCKDFKPNFQYYTDREKFLFIMTSKNLYCMLAKFVHDALDVREEHLKP